MKKHHHDHHVAGIGSIDYWAYASGLRTVNPGLKMATAVFALIFCVATRSIPVCIFVILACAAVTVAIGKVPMRAYLRLLQIPLIFLLLSTLAIIVDFSSQPVGDYHWAVGSVYICFFIDSIWRAVCLMAVALGAVSAMYLLSLSTTISEMTSVLERLHIPGLLIEFMNMIYRFIFIMADTYRQLQTAAQSRMGYSSQTRALRTFGGMMGNLFIVSLLNANTYYDALQARCYHGHLAFLEEEKPLRTVHVGAAVAFCAAIILIWILLR